MTWNKKNDQFALACGLTRQSTLLMLRWILRRAKPNEVGEIEIDLRIFNAWVAKNRGRPFDPKTIREAIAQLDEKSQGLVLITKSYTPWIKKILVRPLENVLQNNAQEQGKYPKLKTSKPVYSDASKEKLNRLLQHNISKLADLLSKIGLIYNHCSLKRIWAIAGQKFDEIERGIELMLYQNSIKPGSITNPQAWLISCLKNRWFESFDLNYSPDLPKFESVKEISRFVREVFQGDKLCPE
ncbi:MAG: hypothetical protein KME09_16355 [Pleurocapsa minor HA4230-MV1]|jgi:hypothetical protein|nr:hypothetical protein [Pleurocapsa minor HA4230-MV1]